MAEPEQQRDAFLADVLDGLARPQKALPSKWFYDERGSALFEEITQLPEYALTRTELEILQEAAPAIARMIPAGGVLVEFGSGAGRKTRILLDAAPQLAVYVPIDISMPGLESAADAIRNDYPDLVVAPLAADFTAALALPPPARGRPAIGFFPGSTIGNLGPSDASAFLESSRRLLGPGAQLVVGIDLEKPLEHLIAAYDDGAGVTAAFNRNILARANRELDADFDPGSFVHEARWNARKRRIEMHLVSRRDQEVVIAGHRFAFREGESIHTENAHKYTIDRFAALAATAGWTVAEVWTDDGQTFAVLRLDGPSG